MINCSEFLHLGYRDKETDPSTGFVSCLGAVACAFRKQGWSPKYLDPAVLCKGGRGVDPFAWERIGGEACNAKEDGDIILSGPASQPHVDVLVDPPLGLTFSSLEFTGAMVRSLDEIRAVRGVYRLRKEYR